MTSGDDLGVAPPLRFGAVPLAGRAALAPLSGVTDPVFRRIAGRFGAAYTVSEMVASDELVSGSEEARLRAESSGVGPHIVQLAGCDAGWLAEAARVAEGAGADVIDLNMGCPAKRVTGGLAGSALMRDPGRAARLIGAVTAAVRVPVTVKMRLGWDETHLNAPDLARVAWSLGAAAVTVHGRTRQQFYRGQADWARIGAVVEAVPIPVVANGDIDSSRSAWACLQASGAAAVMIGRAAIGRPWLVGQVSAALAGWSAPEPSPAEKADAAVEHYRGLLALYGRSVGIRHARKHLAAYADASPEGDPAGCARLVVSEDPAEVAGLMRSLLGVGLREAA